MNRTSSYKKHKPKGIFYPLTAIVLCVCLITGDALLYASAVVPSLQSETQVNPLGIPVQFGTVEEFSPDYDAAGSMLPSVIYIQDAHDSLEAQENIAAIIDYLVKHLGVETVFEEGYEGKVPSDVFFGDLQDPAVKERVSYYLMDQLRVSGAEYAHINRAAGQSGCRESTKFCGGDFELIGADSFKLHRENVEWYQKNHQVRRETQKDLVKIKKYILKLSVRFLGKEIKQWMNLKQRLDLGNVELFDYLKRFTRLWAESNPAGNVRAQYPNIEMLLAAGRTRGDNAVEKLKHAINYKNLFREIYRMENDFARGYLENERDKAIFDYFKILSLLEKLNTIELSSEEYAAVREMLAELDTKTITGFIANTAGESLVLSNRWEENIQNAVRFYETAYKRDQNIESKLKDFSERNTGKPAVMVFGGFHKDEIKEIFHKLHLSYCIITPAIQKISKRHRNYYKQLMNLGYDSIQIPVNLTRATSQPRGMSIAAMTPGQDKVFKTEIRILGDVIRSMREQGINLTPDEIDLAIRRQNFKERVVETYRSELRNFSVVGSSATDRLKFLLREVSEITMSDGFRYIPLTRFHGALVDRKRLRKRRSVMAETIREILSESLPQLRRPNPKGGETLPDHWFRSGRAGYYRIDDLFPGLHPESEEAAVLIGIGKELGWWRVFPDIQVREHSLTALRTFRSALPLIGNLHPEILPSFGFTQRRGELRNETDYLPEVELNEQHQMTDAVKLNRLVEFVVRHPIPDDVLFGRVPDSFEEVRKSYQSWLNPDELPLSSEFILQFYDRGIDPGIAVVVAKTQFSTRQRHFFLVIDVLEKRLVAGAPIRWDGTEPDIRAFPFWRRTFKKKKGYFERAMKLSLLKHKVSSWVFDVVEDRPGGLEEAVTRMLRDDRFVRHEASGSAHFSISLAARPELRTEEVVAKLLYAGIPNSLISQEAFQGFSAFDLKGNLLEYFGRLPEKSEIENLYQRAGSFYLRTVFIPASKGEREGGIRLPVYRIEGRNQKSFQTTTVPETAHHELALIKIDSGNVPSNVWYVKNRRSAPRDIQTLPILKVYSDKSVLVDAVMKLNNEKINTIRQEYGLLGDLFVEKTLEAGEGQESANFIVASTLDVVPINRYAFHSSMAGQVVRARLNENAIVTEIERDGAPVDLVAVRTIDGRMIATGQMYEQKTVVKFAKKYGGVVLSRKVPASGNFRLALYRYVLPEYAGQEIRVYYDADGQRRKMTLPAVMEKKAVEIDLRAVTTGAFSYVSALEKEESWLERRVPHAFEFYDRIPMQNLLRNITDDENLFRVLSSLVPERKLTDEAAAFLLDVVRQADDALYRLAGIDKKWKSGKRVIGREHERLLMLFASDDSKTRRKAFSAQLSPKEKMSLAIKVRHGIQAQNLLIRYHMRLIPLVFPKINGLKKRLRKEPEQTGILFSLGVDFLRKAIWANDSNEVKQFYVFAQTKLKYGLINALRDGQIFMDTGAEQTFEQTASSESSDSVNTELIQKLIEGLEPLDQQIVYLYVAEHLMQPAIAERLNVPQYTISRHWLKVLDRIILHDRGKLKIIQTLGSPHVQKIVNARIGKIKASKKRSKRPEMRSDFETAFVEARNEIVTSGGYSFFQNDMRNMVVASFPAILRTFWDELHQKLYETQANSFYMLFIEGTDSFPARAVFDTYLAELIEKGSSFLRFKRADTDKEFKNWFNSYLDRTPIGTAIKGRVYFPGFLHEAILAYAIWDQTLTERGLNHSDYPLAIDIYDKPDETGLFEKMRNNQILYDEEDLKVLSEMGYPWEPYFEKAERGYVLKPEVYAAFKYHAFDFETEQPEEVPTVAEQPDFLFANYGLAYLSNRDQAQRFLDQLAKEDGYYSLRPFELRNEVLSGILQAFQTADFSLVQAAPAVIYVDAAMLEHTELRTEVFAAAYQTQALEHLRFVIFNAEQLGLNLFRQFAKLKNVRLVREGFEKAAGMQPQMESVKRVKVVDGESVKAYPGVEVFRLQEAVDIWAALIRAITDNTVVGIGLVDGAYQVIDRTLNNLITAFRNTLEVAIAA